MINTRTRIGHPFVSQCLEQITLATDKQIKKELWHVFGILSHRLNENLKFDIDYQKRKYINSKTKSNKILFENEKKWILVDTKEFISYMKKNKLFEINLDKILKEIDWSIEILKHE